jgi:PAS domain S-box-containing protein
MDGRLLLGEAAPDDPNFEAVFRHMPNMAMLLDRNLNIIAATDAYLRATGAERDKIIGRPVFEAFPDNPDTPDVKAGQNLRTSFEWVFRNNQADRMSVQQHDRRAPTGADGADGAFAARFWKPLNSPIIDSDGAVRWVLHEVEDVTEAHQAEDDASPGDPRTSARRDIVYRLRGANSILSRLPDPLFEPLARHLKPVPLKRDQVLIAPGKSIEILYFPLDGLISVGRRLADGSLTEVALGGSGGVVGFSSIIGEPFDDLEYTVLLPGSALAMPSRAFTSLLAVYPQLRSEIVHLFESRLISQLSRNAACMARHNLDQRLARWLLSALARSGEATLPIRHETLAMILGVRRAGVSEEVGELTAAGILETGRDRITILDRRRLLARSCECFEQAEAHRAEILGPEMRSPLTHQAMSELTARFYAIGEQDAGSV